MNKSGIGIGDGFLPSRVGRQKAEAAEKVIATAK
jgi:hypothetical protein